MWPIIGASATGGCSATTIATGLPSSSFVSMYGEVAATCGDVNGGDGSGE